VSAGDGDAAVVARPGPGPTGLSGARSPSREDRVVLALCLLLVFVVVGLHVRKYPQVSPIDELQHLDYVIKGPAALIAQGERVGQEAMRTQACHGIDAAFEGTPPCETPGPLDPELFQERGFNTAYVHPPPYYSITALLALVTGPVAGLEETFTAARAAGALWLCAAVWLLWRLLVHLGAAPLSQLALLSLVIVAPAVILASSTITPDASALLTGGAVLAAVWLWDEGVLSHWVAAIAVAVTLAMKFTHVGIVAFAVVFLAVRSLQQAPLEAWRTSPVHRRHARAIGAIVASTLAMLVLWTGIQRLVAVEAESEISMVQTFKTDEFPSSQMLGQIDAGFSPLQAPYFDPLLRIHYLVSLNHVLDTAMLLAIGSVAVFAAGRTRERALAAATAAAMLALGPMTVLSSYVSSGSVSVPIPSRYGLPLVPGAVLCAVPAMQRRWTRVGVVTFAVFAVALTVQRLVRF
jgi:hypothetical protein